MPSREAEDKLLYEQCTHLVMAVLSVIKEMGGSSVDSIQGQGRSLVGVICQLRPWG